MTDVEFDTWLHDLDLIGYRSAAELQRMAGDAEGEGDVKLSTQLSVAARRRGDLESACRALSKLGRLLETERAVVQETLTALGIRQAGDHEGYVPR